MLIDDLNSPGSSLRVERLDEDRKGDWALVVLKETGLYEFESSQNVRFTSSMKSIHEFLTRWAFDLFDE